MGRSPLPLEGCHVLVVDEDGTTRDLSTVLLTYFGAVVITADAATDAITRLARIQPDVALTALACYDRDGDPR